MPYRLPKTLEPLYPLGSRCPPKCLQLPCSSCPPPYCSASCPSWFPTAFRVKFKSPISGGEAPPPLAPSSCSPHTPQPRPQALCPLQGALVPMAPSQHLQCPRPGPRLPLPSVGGTLGPAANLAPRSLLAAYWTNLTNKTWCIRSTF